MNMLNTNSTMADVEAKAIAQHWSKAELNKVIDNLLDKGEYEEAAIFAKIYTRRYGRKTK